MKNKNNRMFRRVCTAALSAALLFSAARAAELKQPFASDTGIELSLTNPVSNISVGDEAYARVEFGSEIENDLWGYEFELEYDNNYLTYLKTDSGIGDACVTAEIIESGVVKLAFSKTEETQSVRTAPATVRFRADRAGNASVTLRSAAVVNSDMGYEEFNNLNDSVTINIKSNAAPSGGGSGGGFGGGYSGGYSGGGTFSVEGGSNTVTASSQTLEPSASDEPVVASEIFNDLSGFDWARPAIEKLYDMGAAGGYEDGGFHPGSAVTRAEFCKFVTAALGIEPPNEFSNKFADVANDDWYAPYVSAAADLKIVNGYEDGYFRPDASITREEAAAIICRAAEALALPVGDTRLNINFRDENEIQDVFVGYVDKLYTAGIINGDDDGSFRPADSLNRAETAQMIANLLGAISPKPSDNPDEPEISSEPKAGRMLKAAESGPSAEPDDNNAPVQSSDPNIPTAVPGASVEPIESEKPAATEPPVQTEKPDGGAFREDVAFECSGLDELYSYENIYAYEVPDDGSRDAFYDDFTTFQRPGAGDAYIAYRIPYAEKVRVESYFYAGEPLRDLEFETSKDGENWSAAEFGCSYLEAEGKWTRAVYTITMKDDSPFVKIKYPETVNSWTPLVSRVSAEIGEPSASGIAIDGEREPIIPMYDSAEYKYSASLIDQIGEVYPGDVRLSIKESDIPSLAISENGTVIVRSDMADGAVFTLLAESGEFSAELRVKLKAALLGDLDLDGDVDRNDVEISVADYNKTGASADWLKVRIGDINRDGKISVIDIAYITKKAADKNE